MGAQWRCGPSRRDYANGYNFGLSSAERAAMLEAQGGRCPICLRDEPGPKGWHLDHDHRFDKKDRRGHRAVLCCYCNPGLGCFRDDPDALERAAAYLRSHRLRLAA
jgi:hypothetical protein